MFTKMREHEPVVLIINFQKVSNLLEKEELFLQDGDVQLDEQISASGICQMHNSLFFMSY